MCSGNVILTFIGVCFLHIKLFLSVFITLLLLLLLLIRLNCQYCYLSRLVVYTINISLLLFDNQQKRLWPDVSSYRLLDNNTEHILLR